MKKYVSLSLVLMSACLVVSCKKKGGPTGPTTPATTYTITIVCSSNVLKIGITETFTATYNGSDGSSAAITTGVWGGDNSSVATVVEGTGQVTIVGSGEVTIYVDYKGIRGTILIRGVPNYQGTWTGNFAVASCTATGAIAAENYCNDYGIGKVIGTNLVLTQNGAAVQGQGTIGNRTVSISGSIRINGGVGLSSTPGVPLTEIRILIWDLFSTTPGICTGKVFEGLTKPPAIGEGGMEGNIQTLTRTSLF